ncbi:hypothetical protein L3X38_013523 [Prunus dulcis]|uniref:Uncharacterized protein n=1 Tax=Prunus dulcis TaxID=3755 RepID=A0AAD4WNW6_PRUDU|nr:hypothetical protein L3X38_013523 [Prunus dulcis]
MEATGSGMEDLRGPLRSNDERSLYICSMDFNNVSVSYAIHSIKLSDLFSSSCSCRFDPDLPTNSNPTAIGDPDLPTNRDPTAIGGDGDRSKCPWCSKCPSCSKSLKAPDEEDCSELNHPSEEDCSELNHPDDTTTRTACAACSKGNSDLCYRASLTGEFLPAVMGCGVFGSQIVFAGGLKFNITTVDGPLKRRFGPDASSAVYGFETRDPNPTIKMSGRDRMFGEMFGEGICHPLLVEVSGKLYALARKEEFFSVSEPTYFQVFDPNFKKWSPLPAPPILEKGHISSSSLAIMGNFILMSTPNIPMVYGFDTENDAGWIEIGTPRFFCGRSLPFKGKALVVADNNGYFLFTFGSAIIVHFIGADHGQVIKELPLPQDVPVEFRKPDEPLYHRFIQLEGQKVCLVMTISTIEKLRVMVLTFEFSPPDVRHVHTRYFNCDITSSTMIGAFVL